MAKISLECISKTFVETAMSHGISANQAKEAFQEAKMDMDLHKNDRCYKFADSLEKVTKKLATGLVECQMTCIWF